MSAERSPFQSTNGVMPSWVDEEPTLNSGHLAGDESASSAAPHSSPLFEARCASIGDAYVRSFDDCRRLVHRVRPRDAVSISCASEARHATPKAAQPGGGGINRQISMLRVASPQQCGLPDGVDGVRLRLPPEFGVKERDAFYRSLA